jgi:DNA invertase Pin-like site-specific DNA recombinase
VIYARQSIDKTGELAAVTRQLGGCRELVVRNDWDLVEEYVDNDVSASKGKRPAYERMIDAVKAGNVDVIVSWAPDRLVRRMRDIEDVLDVAEDHGISLATVSGAIDITTPYGRGVARIFAAIGQQEAEQKGVRQMAANHQRRENGVQPWSRRPYGYTLAAGEIVVVASEAAELRAAAAKVLTGATLGSCVRDLEARGVPTATGKPWTVTSLRRCLVNPRTAGMVAHHGVTVAVGTWPAILDPDTHTRIVAHLSDPSRRTQLSTTTKYLLSGRAICGRCGGPMYASPMGPKDRRWMVYRCRTAHLARRLDLVDEVVAAVVVARLSREDAAELLVSAGEDADALRDEALALRARLDDLAMLLAEGRLTVDGVREASASLRKKLDAVERRRVSADRPAPLGALVAAEDVRAAWETLSLAERRAVLDVLCEVTILSAPNKGARFTRDQVKITWKSGTA